MPLKWKWKPRPSKYGSSATVRDGIRFDSKREADYYMKLTVLKKAGQIAFFLRQVPFPLPGGTKLVLDFIEFWANGEIRFVDVKGFAKSEYKVKKREIEACYNIEIEEA